MNCLGYEQIDLNNPGPLTVSALTIPAGTSFVEIQAQAEGDINYVLDGSTPGTSRGMILQAGGVKVEVNEFNLRNIGFVKSGANTKLNIQYFGRTFS